MHFFDGFAVLRAGLQVIYHMDSLDYQNLTFLFNFSLRLAAQQTFAGGNLARFQRAAKSAGQSAGRRGHHVVQGGRLGGMHFRVDAVMFGNFGMDTEQNRSRGRGQKGSPQGSLDSFDSGS